MMIHTRSATVSHLWIGLLRRIVHRPDARQAWLVTASRLLQNALGFALSVVVVHQFGITTMGTFTLAALAVVIQATLLTMGLPYVLAKSALPVAQRNTIGLVVMLLAAVLAVPLGLAMGWGFGRDVHEAATLALLSLGGAYFAQSAIADALLVLQHRTGRIPFSPLGNLVGLALATLLADDTVAFAALLAVGRLVGIAAMVAGLPFQRCRLRDLGQHLREGSRYVVPDTAGLAADQLTTGLLALLATRAELGLFGLCRQLLTAAETPMWSRLLVHYPQLCARADAAGALARDMWRRGWLVALGMALAAIVLSITAYRTPDVAWLGPLLMLAVPFRYLVGTAEMTLRARSALVQVNRLVAIRCALTLALVPLGLLAVRLPGALLGIVLSAALMAWLARLALREGPPPSPPESA